MALWFVPPTVVLASLVALVIVVALLRHSFGVKLRQRPVILAGNGFPVAAFDLRSVLPQA